IDFSRRFGVEFQYPIAGFALARLHRGLGGAENAGGHENLIAVSAASLPLHNSSGAYRPICPAARAVVFALAFMMSRQPGNFSQAKARHAASLGDSAWLNGWQQRACWPLSP